jgi:Phosphoadenosine phosphosulfate reductase family
LANLETHRVRVGRLRCFSAVFSAGGRSRKLPFSGIELPTYWRPSHDFGPGLPSQGCRFHVRPRRPRIFSFRTASHRWDPRSQRPELWKLYNGRIRKGESIRVLPLSNWTELDIWQYIEAQNIPVVPPYSAKERPTVVMAP